MHYLVLSLSFLSLLLPFHAPASAPPRPVTIKAALKRVAALPEIEAWTAYVAKSSRKAKRGGAIARNSDPEVIDGVEYWSIDFMEWFVEDDREGSMAHRWDTFLVRLSDGKIFYHDLMEDRILSLANWRREFQPMKRITR